LSRVVLDVDFVDSHECFSSARVNLLATFVVASISVSLLLAMWPIFSVVDAAKELRAIASSLLGPTLVINLPKTDCSRNETLADYPNRFGSAAGADLGQLILRIARNSHRNSA
jgi:hypothetical protein